MSSHDDPQPHNRPGALAAFSAVADSIRAGVHVPRSSDLTPRRQLTPPPTIQSASQPHALSGFSSSTVNDGGWCSSDFALGAGMVIIQPSTHKIVVLHSLTDPDGEWFFPKGRKDIGESLQEAALREAYEESGYKVEPLPLCNPTRQPPSPDDPDARARPNTEAIFTNVMFWTAGRKTEYFTFWYVGQISEDAVPQERKMLVNEQDYTAHLFTYEEALERVWGQQKNVLEYAWAVYLYTLNQRSLLKN